MIFSRHPVLLALAIGTLCLSAVVGLQAQDEKKAAETKTTEPAEEKKADPEAKAAEEEAAKQAEFMEQVSEMFPLGREFFGVKIPNYEGDTLTSVIKSSKMKRIDDNKLDMEDLFITMYEETGEANTFIEMEHAIYDRTEEQLVSKTPTRIWQPEYEMKGDYMLYDKKTGNVIMKRSRERQVEMTIFGSGGLLPTQENAEAEPAALTTLSPTGS